MTRVANVVTLFLCPVWEDWENWENSSILLDSFFLPPKPLKTLLIIQKYICIQEKYIPLLMLEKDIQLLVCKYIKTKYPHTIFRSDFSSGMRMSIGMAKRHKALQSSRAFPDIFIVEPRGRYAGMFIELKTSKNQIFKKDGTMRKNEHFIEQAQMLLNLSTRGFKAVFGLGYADTIRQIDLYFEGD